MKSFFKQERKIKGINRNLQQPCSQRVRAFPRSDESPHDKESFAISTLVVACSCTHSASYSVLIKKMHVFWEKCHC